MNRIIAIACTVLFILFIGLVSYWYFSSQVGNTPDDELATVAPTETPEVVYIVITSEPTTVITATPEPTQEPTTVPTEEPTQVPTQEPTAVPTEEPTQVPTQVPTAVPTAEPTQVPTQEPTVAPTAEPTPEPTIVPSEEPIRNNYESIRAELSTLTNGGGIYPDYESDATYDLYNYIEIVDYSDKQLFTCLTTPFINGIAQWVDLQFDSSLHGTDALKFALESTINRNNNRVMIIYNPDNISNISAVFDEIEQSGDYENANRIMLDYLYQYTYKNPDNPYERLFITDK